jgi:hypothetical protein
MGLSQMRLGRWRRWIGLVSGHQMCRVSQDSGRGTHSLLFDTSADYFHGLGVEGDGTGSVDSLWISFDGTKSV